MEKRMLNSIEICDEIIVSYEKKAKYPIAKSFVLGVFAGIFIALAGFASGATAYSIPNYGVSKLVAGVIFPVGLILIILCGADLFTGNTLLLVPYANRRINLLNVLKNWSVVFIANFIGIFFVCFLLYNSGIIDKNIELGGYILKTATIKANYKFSNVLFSGILCNILVAVAVWVSFGAKDIIGKIFAIFFPVMTFIISGFEHCVANMYYLTMGLMIKDNVSFAEAAHIETVKLQHLNIKNAIIKNMIPSTIGNIIGGGVIIGLGFYFALKVIEYNKNKDIKIKKIS